MKTLSRAAAFALLLALFITPLSVHSAREDVCADAPAAVALAEKPASDTEAAQTLFPCVDAGNIACVSIVTPSQEFQFRRDHSQSVSVNGRIADSDIFATLLSQIVELPVCTDDPFTPDPVPVMTLSILTHDGADYSANFYTDATGKRALIASGTEDSPVYRHTDAWRIGTLLMTCEGTRIQDESGNEAPAE